MSVSPAQNTLKPPPVPEVATVTLTPGSTSRKRSAAASVSGATVDEPSTATEPVRPSPAGSSVVVAHAERTNVAATAMAAMLP